MSCCLFSQEQIGFDIIGENSNDDFGSALAINDDGNIVAIGAHRRNSGKGVLEIYRFQNGNWELMGNRILGTNSNSWFGTQVALTSSGNRLIVGAYRENITRIYDYIDNDWTLSGEIAFGMPSWDTHFGYGVDISKDGRTVAISATHYPQSTVHRGVVNIYKEFNGEWNQIGDGIQGEFDEDQSGWDIDLSNNGNTIAIGSIGNDNNGENAGQVRVFFYENGSWSQMGQSIYGEHKHLSFGWNLDMSENGQYIVVGAPIDWTGIQTEFHYTIVYEYSNGNWFKKGLKMYGYSTQNFGYDVSITDDGNRVAISVPNDSKCPIQIYDFNDSDWNLVGAINHDQEFNNLGISIAMNPNGKVITGASSGGSGLAVVYQLDELRKPECTVEEIIEEEEEVVEEENNSLNLYFPNVIKISSSSSENSIFFGQGGSAISYSMTIFDRWGNSIFTNDNASSNIADDGWSPKNDMVQGVYIYIVRYFIDKKEINIVGDVTLLK